MEWAKPGVACVCIDADWNNDFVQSLGIEPPNRLPMIHEVLTISGVFRNPFSLGGIALTFDELGHRWGFAVENFKPVVTTDRTEEQDISLFRDIADHAKIDVLASALNRRWREEM